MGLERCAVDAHDVTGRGHRLHCCAPVLPMLLESPRVRWPRLPKALAFPIFTKHWPEVQQPHALDMQQHRASTAASRQPSRRRGAMPWSILHQTMPRSSLTIHPSGFCQDISLPYTHFDSQPRVAVCHGLLPTKSRLQLMPSHVRPYMHT